jgi:hypothetical protein
VTYIDHLIAAFVLGFLFTEGVINWRLRGRAIKAEAEVARLQKLLDGLVLRVVGQSELLSKQAEKPVAASSTERYCQSAQDGECIWERCPQNRDGEPEKTGRSCPLKQYETW